MPTFIIKIKTIREKTHLRPWLGSELEYMYYTQIKGIKKKKKVG